MEKRRRTFWLVRDRYRRLGFTAGLIGAMVAIALVAAFAVRTGPAAAVQSPTFIIQSLLIVAAGLGLPRLVVHGLWRQQRRRNWQEWD